MPELSTTKRKTEPGCCVDKRFGGAGCTARTCMTLPAGATCGGCAFFAHCTRMYGVTAETGTCDFFPRRFTRGPDATD